MRSTALIEQVLQGRFTPISAGIIDQLCPYCENLFDEVDLLTELILEAMEGYEATKIQTDEDSKRPN